MVDMHDDIYDQCFLELSFFKLHLCDEDFTINEDALILNWMKFNNEEKDGIIVLC